MNMKSLQIKLMKFKLRYFKKQCDPYYFTRILQIEGLEIGSHTVFYDPLSQTIDRQRPWMLKIGDYCKITKGTVILCHDYSRSVLRRVCGEIIGEADETIIGDNVFIGMNSIILMGAHIGNNVIIGAGSVVSGKIPDNVVVAGNPAKVIRTLDQHLEIRKSKSKEEAKLYFSDFVKKYDREPTESEMGPFFPLFLKRSKEELVCAKINTNLNGDSQEDIIQCFVHGKSEFESYEEFIKWAKL